MNKSTSQSIQKQSVSLQKFAQSLTQAEKVAATQIIKYYDVLAALKQTRLESGFTQQQLAEKASLPRTTITKIESGKHNPTIETLMTIASAMNKQIQIQVV